MVRMANTLDKAPGTVEDATIDGAVVQDPEAPYGWTTDRKTGERRPKKLPGRPAKDEAPVVVLGESPSVDELKSTRKPKDEPEDRAPGTRPKARRRGGRASKPDEPLPQWKTGQIAKGMNRLYARAGKIVTIMDPEVGRAIIVCTRKDSDDDVTVGEAWEDLAKANPRIRRFLLKLVTGSAWGAVVMAHAPIFMAFLLKDSIRNRLPLANVAMAFVEPNEDGENLVGDAMGGIGPDDMQQMMAFAQQMAEQMAGNANGRAA
jgi:hypothetical protein